MTPRTYPHDPPSANKKITAPTLPGYDVAAWSSDKIPAQTTENAPATLTRSGADQREVTPMARKTLEQRFWEKVDRSGGPDACWPWLGYIAKDGYAGFQHSVAHRYAYKVTKGPIPEGLQLDHICRVRHCVNPDHLEPVTPAENVYRGIGPAAINAGKLYCMRGHRLAGDNLYITAVGKRRCRRCAALRTAEHRRRERAAAASIEFTDAGLLVTEYPLRKDGAGR